MSAFVEHWHKETSSFHLPVGEVTITLDDMVVLLHLPIIGAFYSFEQLHIDDVVYMLVELLECWIYKHFLSIGSAIVDEDYDQRRLRACRWTSGKALPELTYRRRLDRSTPNVVCWIPYGDHRSFREFEFDDYIAPVGKICIVPCQCSSNYMEWVYMILHSFMTPAQQGDPPRVPSVQQYDTFVEPDVPQQLVVAAAPDEPDVDMHCPRHVVDGYVAIANKLEGLLNLRILIEGIEAYTVTEECLSIARSYIGQPTRGHKSRRRQHMDDH
ncbi:Protein MAIN-LIKE 1 [Glycine soja]|uniref:uncharacterized protein LOC114368331 n=1 Tax=Glycine soja TaxID=3848 RepID=UPI00103E1599|nr:uncharacterized protein LOC114368331 [Glycine soja]